MSWLFPALIAVFGWGVTDLFLKLSSRADDRDSHLKISVWYGAWMLVMIPLALPQSETGAGLVQLVAEHPFVFGGALFYALSMLVTNIGLRHLDLSVQSPLENASAAVPPVFFLLWYLVTGRASSVSDIASGWDFLGCAVLIAGIVLLAYAERRERPAPSPVRPAKRLGAAALFFPLLLSVGTGVETIICGVALDPTGGRIGEADLILLNAVAFVLVGGGAWIAIWAKNGRPYNPVARGEWTKCGAGAFELFAEIAYVFALAINPTFVSPVGSGYCVVSVVLSRIILRERPGRFRYLSIAIVVVGILLLSLSEALKS